MGTNYYLHHKNLSPAEIIWQGDDIQELTNGYVWNRNFYKTKQELAKDYFECYHIGKSSNGWKFLIHTHQDLNSFKAYQAKFYDPNYEIYDEYGKKISPDQMVKIIAHRGKNLASHADVDNSILAREITYDSLDDTYEYAYYEFC